MKKIVFITRESYDLAGARIRCYNFAKELKKYGMDTEVLSFADHLGAKSGKEENKLRLRDKIRYNLKAIKKLKKEKDTIFFINRFHYHTFASWFLSILNRNKIIFDLDDWEIRENPKYYFGILPSSKAEFLTRRLAKTASLCIGASRFLVNYLIQFNKKTYYIPSGVNTEKFKPQEVNRDNSKIIFSWIGTMHRKPDIENIKFVIDCFLELRKKYENIFLEIAGDGIYFGELEKMINKVGEKNISLKGWIEPDKMPDYLSIIDIGLVPLIQNTKFNLAKSPTKLFEYMAMAKPVVCSNIGECSCIIKDGENGFLATDKEEFIKKLETLVINYQIRKEIGEQALKTVKENYSLEIIGKKLFNLAKQDSP
ncbi:MAG: glycosyltransferase family 4 protein [Candidatus Omnitrophica bacterium]|nr:glycosyltransferase family 4 protein [Candidatus Omnitrophota bacterium]